MPYPSINTGNWFWQTHGIPKKNVSPVLMLEKLCSSSLFFCDSLQSGYCFPHLTCLIKNRNTSVFLQFSGTSSYSTSQFRKTSIILFARCDTIHKKDQKEDLGRYSPVSLPLVPSRLWNSSLWVQSQGTHRIRPSHFGFRTRPSVPWPSWQGGDQSKAGCYDLRGLFNLNDSVMLQFYLYLFPVVLLPVFSMGLSSVALSLT